MNGRALFVTLLLIGLASSPLHAACPGGVSNSFTVAGEVKNPAVFNLGKLEQFALAQANVTYFAAGSVVTDCYQSVIGAGEFDPFFGGSQIMVAYAIG